MRGEQIKLGPAVKAARMKMELTQMELADRLNISVRYLQTIENENQTPSYTVLERILEYLNIPASTVFESVDGESSPEKERLLYLINNKCDDSDIKVLLAAAEALVSQKNV